MKPDIPARILAGEAPEEWAGVVKLQLALASTEEEAPILMYPENRPWTVFLKPSTKLYGLIRSDRRWGGTKTHSRVRITRGKVTVQNEIREGLTW